MDKNILFESNTDKPEEFIFNGETITNFGNVVIYKDGLTPAMTEIE